MSGLVLVAAHRAPPSSEGAAAALVDRLVRAAPHRASAGAASLVLPGLTAVASRGPAAPADPGALGPFHDRARGVVVVADARLDDAEDLAAAAGLRRPALPELLATLHAQLGARLAARLSGDFAVVIAGERGDWVYAARDAFGARPLFYAEVRGGLVLATEVEQLLAAGVSAELDEELVLELLLQRYTLRERTFFRAIRRLLPGHHLIYRSGRVQTERWFQPPPYELTLATAGDDREGTRALFFAAVARRLRSEHPILAQLSGGLDSSSIVCAAAELIGSGRSSGARVTTVSAVYPGLPCDESRFIDAVAARVALPSERHDGTRSDFADYTAPGLLHPGRPPTSGLAAEREIIGRTGARVLLSGSGGDHVFYERGALRDLARTGELRRLHREISADRYGGGSSPSLWRDALRPLVPGALLEAVAWLRRPPEAPAWLGPALRPLFDERARTARDRAQRERVALEREVETASPQSHTRAETWRWLTSTPMAWNVEVQELEAAKLGLELRLPFLDARLVQHVLSIPGSRRLPAGRMKALLRDAMGDSLPELVRERRVITTFESAVAHHAALHLDALGDVLGGAPRSAAFVDHARLLAVRDDFARAVREGRGGERWMDASLLWAAAMLELWLARVTAARG